MFESGYGIEMMARERGEDFRRERNTYGTSVKRTPGKYRSQIRSFVFSAIESFHPKMQEQEATN